MTISDFHFMRPLFLLALPLAVFVFVWVRKRMSLSQWSRYLPDAAVQALLVKGDKRTLAKPHILCLIWCLLSLAAAGPTWIATPTPTLSNQQSTVLLLDLSPSMLAEDLKPNRLARAKLKLIDTLRELSDGQVALIAYAGDAHTVSPLTDDAKTIESLLSALSPNIMPIAGSNIEAAVALAKQVLSDAGRPNGNILIFTDGIAQSATNKVVALSGSSTISILGVGSTTPTPIPLQGGGFIKDSNQNIVLAELEPATLKSITDATGGIFRLISLTSDDVLALSKPRPLSSEFLSNPNQSSDQWLDLGFVIAGIALLLVLTLFRPGYFYGIAIATAPLLLGLTLLAMPLESMAAGESSWWQRLWKTPDQLAADHYAKNNYADAFKEFENTNWKAAAAYRAKNYAQAAKALSGASTADELYNLGNSLALSQDYKGAIEAYTNALRLKPDHDDAVVNQKLVEDLLSQQDQQNQDQQNQDQQNQDQQNQDQQNQDQQNQDQQSQDQQSQDQQSQDQQNQDQQNQEESSQEETSSESAQDAEDSPPQAEGSQSQAEGSQPQDQEKPSTAEMSEEEVQLDDRSEQWLRGIPDDPSSFLRRKFQYQYEQQQNNPSTSTTQKDERY